MDFLPPLLVLISMAALVAPPLLVLISMAALVALPIIWLAGRPVGNRGGTSAPEPEASAGVALSTPTEARSPLGLIGLAFSIVAVALCFAGMLGFAVSFTPWGESLSVDNDAWFYLTITGAIGLFPAAAGLAYGLFVVVRSRKAGRRDVAGRWAVRLSVIGLLLTGVTLIASFAFSRIG